jgi:IS30 family transposase
MERDWLEAQLEAGRSIESIAREVGKHPSTVAYHVKSTAYDRHTRRSTRLEAGSHATSSNRW